MTKKTASKKKAPKDPEENAKAADPTAAEVKGDQKPEAEATSKAEAKPKAKKRGRPGKKKPASTTKAADKPLTEKEQTTEGSGTKEQETPQAPEARTTVVKNQEDTPKSESVQQQEGPPQKQEENATEAPKAVEKQESKPKPKAKRGTKKPKARGGKKAVKAPEKSEDADKGVEEIKPAAKQGNRVVVASRNPAKIRAAELGFGRMFPDQEFIFDSISVPSGVADQPMTDDETFMGALHRALTAQQEQPEADYWIGLEGGLQEEGDDFYAFAWIMVIGPKGMQGKSRTGTFVLPLEVAELVRDGKELGEADDIIFGKTNSKHSSGAIGILTHGLMDRAEYYAGAVSMALIPFKNPELYSVEDTLIEAEA